MFDDLYDYYYLYKAINVTLLKWLYNINTYIQSSGTNVWAELFQRVLYEWLKTDIYKSTPSLCYEQNSRVIYKVWLSQHNAKLNCAAGMSYLYIN